MGAPAALLFALVTAGLAPVCAVFAVMAQTGRRRNIARTLATVGADTAEQERPASFGARVLRPLAGRLGGLGRALTPRAGVARLQRQLDRAGNPPGWTIERAIAGKGIGLVLGILAGTALGALLGGPTRLLLAVVGGGAIGLFGPDLTLYNIGAKRQDRLRSSLPDVLDTLIICVEAGQGFDAALAQVARNLKGPMAGEAARVLQEMRIGKSRTEALRDLSARTSVPELRSFAAAVVRASQLGIPVAQVLREQAREMRTRRRQRAEEKAQKVPVKVLFPTLFCLFPALFVVILGPGVINILHAFSRS
jgi:tight adherence protein C